MRVADLRAEHLGVPAPEGPSVRDELTEAYRQVLAAS